MEFEIANKFKAVNFTSPDWIKDGYFPNWFLEELLIRLPVKVVFRFKLVSKKWHSIILDPSFVQTYCSRALSLQKSQPWILFSITGHVNSNYDPHFELLVDPYSSNLKWPSYFSLSLPCFPSPDKESDQIYEVSDGFVLYGPKEIGKGFSNYRICNPLTGQWIPIPPHYYYEYVYVKYYNICWGFLTNVKDGLLMSYTVVCLHRSTGQSKGITCDVFLSEVGEWKKYIVPVDITFIVDMDSSSAILDGVMHQMIEDHGLVAYDPHKHPDRVRIIALPDRYRDLDSNLCAAYQGKLRLFRAYCPWDCLQSFNIWVLNNYSSGEWCLQHQVYFNDIKICISHPEYWIIKPISFHPYDSDIVYMRIKGMIHSYNIKTRELKIPKDFEHVKEDSGKASFKSSQTLMIPPWPMSFSRSLLENLPNKMSNYNAALQGQIPVIDFQGIERGGSRRMEIIEEIRKASETRGSFQMINHGVPKSVMDLILEGTRKFHEQPKEAKMEYYSSESRQFAIRQTLIKRNKILDVANSRNAFSCGFPDGAVYSEAIPSVCREEILEYVKYLKDLKNSLSELLSEALGLKQDFLGQMYCMQSEYLTCHYYPPCPEPETLGTRKHLDPTCLTIIVQDNTGGLQISQDGNWIDVPPVEGALIANMGNYLQLLTNDKFKSVEYRVLPKPTGTHVSAACFFYPDCFHSQEPYGPIKQLVSFGDNPPLYHNISFREFARAIEFQTQHYNPPGLSIFKL